MPASAPPVALIVLTRQSPEALDLSLASLYNQTFREFEVLVADTTRLDRYDPVVALHAEHLDQPLRHIHAPGDPLNQARALNAAVASTQSEYLVFMGGDCIAQPGFIEAHVDAAEYGYFACGESLPLDPQLSGRVSAETIGSGQLFDEGWLTSASPGWVKQHLRTSPVGMLRDWLRRDTPGQQYWNCDASSCFRDDAMKINGFDMDVEDWRQDRDFANRLQNNGMEPVRPAVAGNVMQLYRHPMPDLQPTGGRLPVKLAPAGEVRASHGVEELLSAVQG